MKNLKLFALCVLCALFGAWALPPSPMESVTKYNVILVHGAADSSSGFIAKCDGSVRDAYSQLEWKRLYPSKAQKGFYFCKEHFAGAKV